MSESVAGFTEQSSVIEHELAFDTDEMRQNWNSALIRTQLATPWIDWELEPDPGATLLHIAREDLGLKTKKEEYHAVHRLAQEIASYDGAEEYQEDEGDR